MDEADQLNEDLGDEEGNFEWRCIGRKGEGVIVKVKVHNNNRVIQQPIWLVVSTQHWSQSGATWPERQSLDHAPSPAREGEEEYISGEEDVTVEMEVEEGCGGSGGGSGGGHRGSAKQEEEEGQRQPSSCFKQPGRRKHRLFNNIY